MAEKSKILIIGGTGYMGKFIALASAEQGNPTFVLTREISPADKDKSALLAKFQNLGVELVIGDLNDKESLVNAVKKVDVVISTVGGKSAAHQVTLIKAIKEAGNVKRFLPSEFGIDPDYASGVDPAKSIFEGKRKIRSMVKEEGIPYTFVVCNGFAGYFLPKIGQLNTPTAPREKVTILGDGNKKAVFIKEEDIALITIKAVDDPRTLNKALIFRPEGNTKSFNEVVSIWETKIGKTLEKTYVSDEQFLKNIQDTPGANTMLSISYSTFVEGSATNYEIKPEYGVEASELYPNFKFTTIDEYLTDIA